MREKTFQMKARCCFPLSICGANKEIFPKHTFYEVNQQLKVIRAIFNDCKEVNSSFRVCCEETVKIGENHVFRLGYGYLSLYIKMRLSRKWKKKNICIKYIEIVQSHDFQKF